MTIWTLILPAGYGGYGTSMYGDFYGDYAGIATLDLATEWVRIP